ncbi:hypothetical protein [Oleiharenicola sp. Vm1]|uniref:hypothetical protein n=1 Tax=Oleiharenicola sp. Vm1 TaxID=3398393 RepID=UPI0039F4BB42
MPGRIIALYVILGLRFLTGGIAMVKSFPPASAASAFTSSVATFEFAACLFMLIALFQRKSWVVWVFRGYIAIVIPFSLILMWFAALAKERNGEDFAWNAFAGGVMAAIGFAWFAWYVGRGPTREFLHAQVAGKQEPQLTAKREEHAQ